MAQLRDEEDVTLKALEIAHTLLFRLRTVDEERLIVIHFLVVVVLKRELEVRRSQEYEA